jgi:hypothetical protein
LLQDGAAVAPAEGKLAFALEGYGYFVGKRK